MKVKNIFGSMSGFIKQHDTAILTGITIVSTVGAVVLTWRARPKCEEILMQLEDDGATGTEKAVAVAKELVAPGILTAVAVGSALLNQKRTGDKISSLVSTIQLSQMARDEYEKSTKKLVGEEKEQEIRTEAARTVAEQKPVTVSEVIDTGHGKYIFREPWSGVTFRANKDWVVAVVERSSKTLERAKNKLGDEYVFTLYDFFVELNVPEDQIPNCARVLGWSWAKGHESILDPFVPFEYGGEEPGYLLEFSPSGRPKLIDVYSDQYVDN